MLCFGRELKQPCAICGPTFETYELPRENCIEELHGTDMKRFEELYERKHHNLRTVYLRRPNIII